MIKRATLRVADTQANVDLRSADGRCIIDARQTAPPSHVRDVELYPTAMRIQSQCIRRDFPIIGGHALGMGT